MSSEPDDAAARGTVQGQRTGVRVLAEVILEEVVGSVAVAVHSSGCGCQTDQVGMVVDSKYLAYEAC